ncbi:scavenger receptor cysteine-rich domain-containing protein SCART1 [Osmerus eperlanus]|uniref:scavenger receptor cysteine-rich domain-containing protein SCART1 n=1 Tax=Osmerus eperlanus TaxID=29151 RepID=UPI002E105886
MSLLLLLLWATVLHLESTQGLVRLKLKGVNAPCQGYIQVFREGVWGFVGDQDWTDANEQVVCRSAGCGARDASTARERFVMHPSPGDVTWMNEVKCFGTEEHLWLCHFPGWNVSIYNKDTVRMIYCTENISLSLSKGEGACAGSLLINSSSGPGFLCADKSVSDVAAKLACAALECGGMRKTHLPRGLPAGHASMRAFSLGSCLGDEQHLWQCGVKPDTKCTQPLSITCSGHTKLSISGRNMCAGPLLVEKGSTWTPVCQSSFSLNDTTPSSMCLQMRCGSSGRLEPAQCNGSTPLTLTCSASLDEAQLVLMHNRKPSHCFGSVHVNRSGVLEGVCSDGWDKTDGAVVCRELGCGAVIYPEEGSITQGGSITQAGRFNMVECEKNDLHLLHCLSRYEQRSISCKEARVVCTDSMKVRLVDGPGRCAGRVELQYEGSWWRVSEEGWIRANSDSVCGSLGCGLSQTTTDRFFQGTGEVFSHKLVCPTGSDRLANCSISINFRPAVNLQTKMKMLTCKDHALLYLSGGSGCSGVVQVQNDGHTYFLSGSNSTWHQDSAHVVCRHLRCGASVSFTTINASDVSDVSHQRMRSYNCSSREDSLFDCPMTEGQTEGANQSEVAVVRCSGSRSMRLQTSCWGQVEVCVDADCRALSQEGLTEGQAQRLCEDLGCGNTLPPTADRVEQKVGVSFLSLHQAQASLPLEQASMVPCRGELCTTRPAAHVFCSGSITAQLVDPRDKCSGNVEMFYPGKTRLVCQEALQKAEAKNAICSELGCGTPLSLLQYFGSPRLRGLSVASLVCPPWSSRTRNCSVSLEQSCSPVGLRCSEWRRMMLKLPDAPEAKCEGVVFVYSERGCTRVPSEGWTAAEGRVLCNNLGCGDYKSHESRVSSSTSWWDRSYRCGNDSNIWECERNETTTSRKQLYLRCNGTYPSTHRRASPLPKTSTLQGNCSGELFLGDLGVCDAGWSRNESQIACQGCSNAIDIKSTPTSGGVKGLYVSCLGSEDQLGQCKTIHGSCSTGLVSVACVAGVEVNVSRKCGGRVLVRYRGTWEPVCPLQGKKKEADLLCDKLGCFSSESMTTKPASITPETALRCEDKHTDIKYCVQQEICKERYADAYVYCKGYQEEPHPSELPVSLVVGLSLGALALVTLGLLCFFLRERLVYSVKLTFLGRSVRKQSSFESGDYEEPDLNQMDTLTGLGVNGRRASDSSQSYDDIAGEDDAAAQTLTAGGPAVTKQDRSHVNLLAEPASFEVQQEDSQGSYDDVSSIPMAIIEEAVLVHEIPDIPQHHHDDEPGQPNGRHGDVEAEEEEDEEGYLKPDQQV